ncbi:hypothetical protein [Roseibium sp. M-1]
MTNIQRLLKKKLDWILANSNNDPKIAKSYLIGLTNVLKVNFANPNFAVPLNKDNAEIILEGWSNATQLEDYVKKNTPIVKYDPANPQAYIDNQNKLASQTAFLTGSEMGLAFSVAQNKGFGSEFVDEGSIFYTIGYESISPMEQDAKLKKLVSDIEFVRELFNGVEYDPTNIQHREKLAEIVNDTISDQFDLEAVKRKVALFPNFPSGSPDEIDTTDRATTSRKPTVLPSVALAGSSLGLVSEHFVDVKPPEFIGHFTDLFSNGADATLLGIAAVPVLIKVHEHSEKRKISFGQAARELGLEFTEDFLKSMAAEVGVDLAVSLTPVGALKKAWNILGNLDDVIAVTQLYGEAFPDNEIIQQMAAIARDVEQSEAFGAYVYGRDALTGAIGSAFDWAFGGEDEAEVAARLAGVRGALSGEDGAAAKVVREGGTAAELTDALISEATAGLESGFVPLSNKQMIPGAAPILDPGFSPANGGRPGEVMSDAAGAGGPALPAEPGIGPEAASGQDAGQILEVVPAGSAASMLGQGPAGAAAVERKTSYDRFLRLGTTPEEEAQAKQDYMDLRERSYVDMNGDEEAADLLATERFVVTYGTSKYSPYAEGTVFKYPAENVYLDLHGDGHAYIREDAEALLKERGIKTGNWYLSPNARTGSDWEQGWADDEGYGPRMTLSYDDEAGNRRTLTESFQADVKTAAGRKPGRQAAGPRAEAAERVSAEKPLSGQVSAKAPQNAPVPGAKSLPTARTAAAGTGLVERI